MIVDEGEVGSPAPVGSTGTHVMALAAGAVALVALVATALSGSTIVPIASLVASEPESSVTIVATAVPAASPAIPSRAPYLLVPPPGVSPGYIVVASARPVTAPLPGSRSAGSCEDPARSPMEVVYRMFDLTISGPTAFSECWTPGRAPRDPVLTSYIRARAPVTLTTESVAMQFANGQLSATVAMRGRWQNDPPMGWANDAPRWILLRQQPGGTWTIDAVMESAP